MSQLGSRKGLSGACVSCKQLKRKCNRAHPECSTCVRVGRACSYSDAPLRLHGDTTSLLNSETHEAPSDGTLTSRRPQSDDSPTSFFGIAVSSSDLFRHEVLQKSAVDVAICKDVCNILGERDEIVALAAKYFDTLSHRMPFIWKDRFNSRLRSMHSNPHADFSLLCLCISLVIQHPPKYGQSVLSSVYAVIKSHISLLETSGFLSLEFVQARLLLSVFEIGHGLYPAASISIGACARTARALGLNKKQFKNASLDNSSKQRAEEEKRVWWEIVNLDRFVNLCTGDSLFATEDPSSEDLLPISDDDWAENSFLRHSNTTISSPREIPVAPFARECQIAHLMGRVLRHIFDPTSDTGFHEQEYKQLEKTMQAFFSVLIQAQTSYVDYCAALSMCCSTLFSLYDSELLRNLHDEDTANVIIESMEILATQVAEVTASLFTPIENISMERLSPLVIYSVYQAAAMHLRMWKLTRRKANEGSLDSLKTLLGHFNTRWRVAGIYLDRLDELDLSFPVTMHSMLGASVSARGLQIQAVKP